MRHGGDANDFTNGVFFQWLDCKYEANDAGAAICSKCVAQMEVCMRNPHMYTTMSCPSLAPTEHYAHAVVASEFTCCSICFAIISISRSDFLCCLCMKERRCVYCSVFRRKCYEKILLKTIVATTALIYYLLIEPPNTQLLRSIIGL